MVPGREEVAVDALVHEVGQREGVREDHRGGRAERLEGHEGLQLRRARLAEHVGAQVGRPQLLLGDVAAQQDAVGRPLLVHRGTDAVALLAVADDLGVHVQVGAGAGQVRDRTDQHLHVLLHGQPPHEEHDRMAGMVHLLPRLQLVGARVDAVGDREDVVQAGVLGHGLRGEGRGGGDHRALAHESTHVLPRHPGDDVQEPLRERQERLEVLRHEVVRGDDPDAAPLGLVDGGLADHVVALGVHDVRLDLAVDAAEGGLGVPREHHAVVLVRRRRQGAQQVHGGLRPVLHGVRAGVTARHHDVDLVAARVQRRGEAVAEGGGPVDVRRIGVCGDQHLQGAVGGGPGTVGHGGPSLWWRWHDDVRPVP